MGRDRGEANLFISRSVPFGSAALAPELVFPPARFSEVKLAGADELSLGAAVRSLAVLGAADLRVHVHFNGANYTASRCRSAERVPNRDAAATTAPLAETKPPAFLPEKGKTRVKLAAARLPRSSKNVVFIGKMARPARLERATLCLEGRRSIQLSYGRGV